MTFECIDGKKGDPIFEAYLNKYSSSADEYLKKYDSVYRRYREVKFCENTYAFDKENNYAFFVVNRGFPLPGIRAPGACVLFLDDEMIAFNFVRTYVDVDMKDGFYSENVIKVMPFDPPLGDAEKEKRVRNLIIDALEAIGISGEPYNDSVRLRVVFDVKFGEHIF